MVICVCYLPCWMVVRNPLEVLLGSWGSWGGPEGSGGVLGRAAGVPGGSLGCLGRALKRIIFSICLCFRTLKAPLQKNRDLLSHIWGHRSTAFSILHGAISLRTASGLSTLSLPEKLVEWFIQNNDKKPNIYLKITRKTKDFKFFKNLSYQFVEQPDVLQMYSMMLEY